jgi:hypothetical protein
VEPPLSTRRPFVVNAPFTDIEDLSQSAGALCLNIIVRRVMRDAAVNEPLAGISCGPNHVIVLPGGGPCYL